MEPSLVARLRWRIWFESLWSDDLPTLVKTDVPSDLHGTDRVTWARNKMHAADLMKTLFPADEEPDG